MSQDVKSDTLTPVYIPWKTFENYVSSLKGTTIPHQLDSTIRPTSMSGGVWRQLVSAFKFLDYADPDGVVNESRLRKLVESHGTEKWKDVIREQIVPQYEDILEDLKIESATPGQLNKKFQQNASVDGQMLKKCIRFYLYALREGGVKYSDHLSIRERNSSGTQRKRTRKKTTKKKTPQKPRSETTVKTTEIPADSELADLDRIPVRLDGTRRGYVYFPHDLTSEECSKYEAAITFLAQVVK